MTRWKVTLEYDGSSFCGWQRQENGLSVQQALEEAIFKFSGETVTAFVAGRTDAGVHALGQVAHFDLEKTTKSEIIRDAVNFHLRPHAAVIVQAAAVLPTFHARFDAKARHYRYQVFCRKAPPVIVRHAVWHVPKELEIAPMQDAARSILGHHDFSTFRAQYCQASSPLRTLDALDVERENDLVVFKTHARSFLYHQVRNMVGTLIMVGTRQWSMERFIKAFQARSRREGGPTAPAHGLFFSHVDYPDA